MARISKKLKDTRDRLTALGIEFSEEDTIEALEAMLAASVEVAAQEPEIQEAVAEAVAEQAEPVGDRFEIVELNGRMYKKFYRANLTTDMELLNE